MLIWEFSLRILLIYIFLSSASKSLLSLVRTRDSEMNVELGLSSGQARMPAGSSPLKSLFLAAIPCGVGNAQGEARRLIVEPCEKNPHFLQKIKPLREKR